MSDTYILRDGKGPAAMVEVTGRPGNRVEFSTRGGGMVRTTSAETFERHYRPVTQADFELPYHHAYFDIEGLFGMLPGYTTGELWNGWAKPCFTAEVCEKMVAMGRLQRDDAQDAYFVDEQQEFDEKEVWLPETITFEGQPLKVWAVGAGYWSWDEYKACPHCGKPIETPREDF